MLTRMAPLASLTPKWRWLQFSLRTMLVVVGVLCVALSLWIVPSERQRRAVAAIEALDGTVVYVHTHAANKQFPVTFLRRWLPRDYFNAVEIVDLTKTKVSDAGLTHLQRLKALRWLCLKDTEVTDAGLAHLQGLTDIAELYLTNTQVTDAGLAHLQLLTGLRELSLTNTQVTDAGLVHLRALMDLQSLWLYGTQVTDAGAAQLRKVLPKCKIHAP